MIDLKPGCIVVIGLAFFFGWPIMVVYIAGAICAANILIEFLVPDETEFRKNQQTWGLVKKNNETVEKEETENNENGDEVKMDSNDEKTFKIVVSYDDCKSSEDEDSNNQDVFSSYNEEGAKKVYSDIVAAAKNGKDLVEIIEPGNDDESENQVITTLFFKNNVRRVEMMETTYD